MNKERFKLLIDYCFLKQIPFCVLDIDERTILEDTLGFQAFILYRKLKDLKKEMQKEVIFTFHNIFRRK